VKDGPIPATQEEEEFEVKETACLYLSSNQQAISGYCFGLYTSDNRWPLLQDRRSVCHGQRVNESTIAGKQLEEDTFWHV